MYCEVCPHTDETMLALAPCRYCWEDRTTACAKCEHFPAVKAAYDKVNHYCENCEAGELHGEIHFDGAPGGLPKMVRSVYGDSALQPRRDGEKPEKKPGGVTALDTEVEDKLRIMLSNLFQLDPIELLLIWHYVNHGTAGSFRNPLRELRDRLTNKYDLSEESKSFRAIAHVWKTNIKAKLPELAPFFAAIDDENAGGGR